jgi:hypothetical protein
MGGGGGRRHNDAPHPVPIRTKPNVFLRSRPSSYDTVNGHGHVTSSGSSPNQFIHHPRLQNDRQRGDSSASVSSVAVSSVAVFRNDTIPNIRDTVQFPSLSSTSTVLNSSKLNFKEMVMKNTTTVSQSESAASATVVSVPEKPLPSQKSQKTLSSGNIFSSVFYGGGDGDGDGGYGGGGGGGDGDGDGGGSSISSVLVDSCDRKYDNLYKY